MEQELLSREGKRIERGASALNSAAPNYTEGTELLPPGHRVRREASTALDQEP